MYTNNTYNGKKPILINIVFRYLLLLVCSAVCLPALQASEDTFAESKLIRYEKGDLELTASCFLSDSKQIVIFLPNIFAPFNMQVTLAREIAEQGLSACFSHVFTDLFLPTERNSYNEVPVDGMLALLQSIQRQTGKSIYLVGHGSGSAVAYKLAHRTGQKDAAAQAGISGLILLSPNLLDGVPAPGQEQQYIKLIDRTIVPVFIFQPSYSPHHWHLQKLLAQISKSGTKLRYQSLPDVRDGFALRDDRSEKEQTLRTQMAAIFQTAIKQLTDND